MMEKREVNMDYLRIFCSFLIVLLHFSSSYWNCVPIGSYQFTVMTMYNCFTRAGVPVFIMLSGYFLLGKETAFSLKDYLKRPLKLLLTFYIWAAFYAFQGLIVEWIKTGSVSDDRLNYTMREFIFGHYHMWFCFLIIGYYFLLPIAKKIAEDMQVLTLFIALWILMAFVLPCIVTWAKLPLLSSYLNGFEMNALKGYWGYFLLGYYIKKCGWNKSRRIVIYCLGIISLGVTIFLSVYQSVSTGTYIETWFSTGSPFVLLMSITLFLMFYSMRINTGHRANTFVIKIAETSFFVYMFHVFILEKLNLIGITTVSFNPLFSVPLLSAAAFVFSSLVALLVKKIPYIGRILLYR